MLCSCLSWSDVEGDVKKYVSEQLRNVSLFETTEKGRINLVDGAFSRKRKRNSNEI